jgi:threonine dehydrogenase-like Zn-dependent dehydrogenase
MGADAFVSFGAGEQGEIVEALGGAPDVVFECVGAEGMLAKAAQHVSVYGRVVSLGFCTRPDPLMPALAAYKCAIFQFLVGYGMRDVLFVADQMDKGHADPKGILTRTVSLDALPATFERLREPNDHTKVHMVST